MKDMPYKCQAAGFSSQRSCADSEKECVAGFKCGGVEVTNEVLALLATVIVNGLNQIVPEMLEADEVGNFARAELLRHRKLRPRRQPAGKVVTLTVIPNALRR